MADEILSQRENRRLIEQERIVERTKLSFLECGTALSVIRDEKLYLGMAKTFDQYLKERWGMSRQHAARMITAADTMQALSPRGDKPTSEAQVRPLTQLPEDQRDNAWDEAIKEAAPDPPTHRQVQKIVDKKLGKPSRGAAPKKDSPSSPVTSNGRHKTKDGLIVPDTEEAAQARVELGIPDHVVMEYDDPPETETVDDVIQEKKEQQAIQDEQDDDETWASNLPLAKKLKDRQLAIFKEDAINWRKLTAERERFGKAVAERMNKTKRNRQGPWIKKMRWLMTIKGPQKWVSCPPTEISEGAGCDGIGTVGGFECPRCHGDGYWLG